MTDDIIMIFATRDEFDAFYDQNREHFDAEGIDIETAARKARDRTLAVGGGAAPLFMIGLDA